MDYSKLLTNNGFKVTHKELMSKHTSLNIGGPADYFMSTSKSSELLSVIKVCNDNKLPFLVLGSGTNLLVSDKGIKGVVIAYKGEKSEVVEVKKDNSIFVEVSCSKSLSSLINWAVDKGYSGLENLTGIPGTLGGALIMNAGAGNSSISDVVSNIFIINNEYKESELPLEKAGFKYRESSLSKYPALTKCILKLTKDTNLDLKAVVKKIKQKRKKSQPSGHSAGCIFKNPKGNFAGRLIEQAGCKNLNVGKAIVSDTHSNFLINCGNATCEDFTNLIDSVIKRVFDKFEVNLELEVKIVGEGYDDYR